MIREEINISQSDAQNVLSSSLNTIVYPNRRSDIPKMYVIK